MPSIHSSRPARTRSSKEGEGSHSSACSATTGPRSARPTTRSPSDAPPRPPGAGRPRGGRRSSPRGPRRPGGRRPEDRRDRAAHAPDPSREEAGDLVSADVRLPVTKRLLAQEPAVADLVLERRQALLVRAIRRAPQRLDVDRLVLDVVGDPVEAVAEAASDPARAREASSRRASAPAAQAGDLVVERPDRLGLEAVAPAARSPSRTAISSRGGPSALAARRSFSRRRRRAAGCRRGCRRGRPDRAASG